MGFFCNIIFNCLFSLTYLRKNLFLTSTNKISGNNTTNTNATMINGREEINISAPSPSLDRSINNHQIGTEVIHIRSVEKNKYLKFPHNKQKTIETIAGNNHE